MRISNYIAHMDAVPCKLELVHAGALFYYGDFMYIKLAKNQLFQYNAVRSDGTLHLINQHANVNKVLDLT